MLCKEYRTEDFCCDDYINGVCCKMLSKDGVCCVELDDAGTCSARMEDGRCCTNAQGTCQPSRLQQKLNGPSYMPSILLCLRIDISFGKRLPMGISRDGEGMIEFHWFGWWLQAACCQRYTYMCTDSVGRLGGP